MDLQSILEATPVEIKVALCAGVSTIIASVTTAVVSLLKSRSKSRELKQAQEEYEIQKVKLETEKMVLENKLITGTYTVCPKCGAELLLTDLVFKNDYAKKEVK